MDLGERAPTWTSNIHTDPAVQDFARLGYHLFERPVDPQAAGDLLAKLRADRAYDQGLFQGEAEFDADPQYRGVNPRPGRGLTPRYSGSASNSASPWNRLWS